MRTNSSTEPHTPLVYLDTSALKFASERLIRGRRRPTFTTWGDHEVKIDVTQFVEVYPNARVYQRHAKDLVSLPFIAHLARRGRIRLTTHFETIWEFYRLPKTDDPRGRFYGAPIEDTPNPFEYGRVVAGGFERGVDQQFSFVKSIRHPRFRELSVAVGANPTSKNHKNQLLDAFYLLCAENAGVDYFLTLDFKLIRHVEKHKRWPPQVKLVSPATLVNELTSQRHVGLKDILSFARHVIRERSKPSNHPLEQLVQLGKRLEKRGMFNPRKPT